MFRRHDDVPSYVQWRLWPNALHRDRALRLPLLVIEPVLSLRAVDQLARSSPRRFTMNVSKSLAAAIAATTIVGAVGFAYAQTTSDTPASPAYPQTSSDASAAPVNPSTDAAPAVLAAPAEPKTAVIDPAEAQKAAARDPSMQAPTEGSQGTQSGPAPSAANNSSVTSTPAPVAKDSTMVNEPLPKADRN
jgi:hypothetical protein